MEAWAGHPSNVYGVTHERLGYRDCGHVFVPDCLTHAAGLRAAVRELLVRARLTLDPLHSDESKENRTLLQIQTKNLPLLHLGMVT